MSSLSQLRAAIPEHKREIASVDLSEVFGQPEGTEIFQFSEPSIAHMEESARRGRRIRINYPDLSQETAVSVALLAFCHVAPTGDDLLPLQFYSDIASRNEPLFLKINTAFTAAFPWISDLAEMAREKKES